MMAYMNALLRTPVIYHSFLVIITAAFFINDKFENVQLEIYLIWLYSVF